MSDQIDSPDRRHRLVFPPCRRTVIVADYCPAYAYAGRITLNSGSESPFLISLAMPLERIWSAPGLYFITVTDAGVTAAKYIGETSCLRSRMDNYGIRPRHHLSQDILEKLPALTETSGFTPKNDRSRLDIRPSTSHEWRIREIAQHISAGSTVDVWFATVSSERQRIAIEDKLLGDFEQDLRYCRCAQQSTGWNVARRSGWASQHGRECNARVICRQ